MAGSRLEVLRESAGAAGFAAAAGELIAELVRGMVAPERLISGLRAWSAQDVRRAPYAREVGRIYADYVRELDRLGRVDRELYAWRALDALRAAPHLWGAEPVFFYGFDDLTPLQRDAVETLARVVGVEVTVSLTYEPGREALVARAETVEELRPLARRVAELPAQYAHYAPGSRAPLHHLERSLFAREPVERIDPGDAVILLEAGGERAEAELVAQQIHELRRAGVPGDEIVVVSRSRPRAAPLLGQVFAQYGIALDSGHAPPLGHTPLGRSRCWAPPAARCCRRPRRGRATCSPTCARPGCCRRRRSPTGSTPTCAVLGCTPPRRRASVLAGRCPSSTRWPPPPDPGRALCRLARRLFAAPHRARAATLSPGEELDARALRALVRGVDELAELSLTPAGAALVELLEGLAVAPARAHDADAVLLAEPLEVRARRFRVVFVCGLQEGEFPQPTRPEPFLSDERRWELAAAGGLRLRPREDALDAERYLFYAAVSRATERVYLAYRSSDEEGNLALPSPFIADVAELLSADWPQRRRRRLLADVVWEPDRAPTPRGARRARCRAAAPPTPASSPRAPTCSGRARSARSATARSSRRERSRRSPTAPCGG